MQKLKKVRLMSKILINIASNLRCLIIPVMITLLLQGCSTTQGSADKNSISLSNIDKENYQQALSEFKSGNIKSAEIKFQKIIHNNPNIANAYINLAIIYLNQNHLDLAEDSLSKALKLTPENIYALNYMGIIQRKKGDFAQAKSLYEKALSIEPDYAYAHLNIGILFDLYFYDYKNAIEHYKKYQELTENKDKSVKKWIIDLERRLQKTVASK